MEPQILALIKRRKFAVLSQWKSEIEDRYPFYHGQRPKLRPALLFRTFDSVLRQLKHPESGSELPSMPLLDQMALHTVPPLHWYAEVFLIGEEVMGEFFLSNLTCTRNEFSETLARFQNSLYIAFHRIIQKELQAWHLAIESPGARKSGSGASAAPTVLAAQPTNSR